METLKRCNPYLLQFARLYALYSLGGLVLGAVFRSQAHYLIGLVVLAMAGARTAAAFAANERRPPSSAEKTLLVAGSFLITLLVGVAFIILALLLLLAGLPNLFDLVDAFLRGGLDDVPAAIVLAATALHVAILAIAYGPYAIHRNQRRRDTGPYGTS